MSEEPKQVIGVIHTDKGPKGDPGPPGPQGPQGPPGAPGVGLPDPTPYSDGVSPIVRDQAWTFGRHNEDDIDPGFAITSFDITASPVLFGQTLADPSFAAAYNQALSQLQIDDGAGLQNILLVAENAFGYNNGGGSGMPGRNYVASAFGDIVSFLLRATNVNGVVKTANTSIQIGRFFTYWDSAVPPGSYNQAFITSLGGVAVNNLAELPSFFFSAPTTTPPLHKLMISWPDTLPLPTDWHDQNGERFPMEQVTTGVTLNNGFVNLTYQVLQSVNYVAGFSFTLTPVW